MLLNSKNTSRRFKRCLSLAPYHPTFQLLSYLLANPHPPVCTNIVLSSRHSREHRANRTSGFPEHLHLLVTSPSQLALINPGFVANFASKLQLGSSRVKYASQASRLWGATFLLNAYPGVIG